MNDSRFAVIFIIFILVIVMKAGRRAGSSYAKKKSTTSSSRPTPLRTNVPKESSSSAYGTASRSSGAASSRTASYGSYKMPTDAYAKEYANARSGHIKDLSSGFMEDRQNDWLARQLREERRALKSTSDMFALKMEHLDDCDARDIRNSHAKAHREGRL